MKKTLLFLFVLGLALILRAPGTHAQTAALAITLTGNNSITSANVGNIDWHTNVNADCSVDFSKNSDLSEGMGTNGHLVQVGLPTNDGNFYFTVQLSNLTPATNYYYHVICTTADGQNVTSDIKLLPKNSLTAPLAITFTGNNSITSANVGNIDWHTNVNADCSVDFSNNSDLSGGMGTNGHLVQVGLPTNDGNFYFTVQLSNLTPATNYYYHVICTTADGQNVTSDIKLLPKNSQSAPNTFSLTVNNFNYSNNQGTFNLVNNGNTAAAFYLSIWNNTTNKPLQATAGQTEQYSLTPYQTVQVYLPNSGLAAGVNNITIKEVSLDSKTVYNSQDFSFNTSQNTAPATTDITTINSNASQLYSGNTDSLLAQINQLRNTIAEQASQIKYLASLIKDVPQVPQATLDAINNFITYGVDQNTVKLGAGQRAAVVNSFKSAFDRLPTTQTDITDVVKIANGRWPSQTSPTAIADAKVNFKKVYLRDADMNNANDNAAITIMAYGLQQQAHNRNLKSEAAGIKTFKYVYGRLPSSAQEWNVVAAITYSGASR